MKINLQTRLFPNYNSVRSLAEQQARKEEEAKKKAEKEAEEQLYKDLGRIKTFTLGTTPNFTIDLNRDMLQLDDIEQLIVTFGQFGKLVQREILYFSDNYKVDYELDSEGNYVPLSSSVVRDEKNIFNDEIQFMPTGFKDSEGNDIHRWRHPYQSIRNPKFTYDKIYNKLTLTLSQSDTLTHFRPTDWSVAEYDSEGRTTKKTEKPYWKDNPSLVMIEVKIRVRRSIDNHFNEQVVIRPQEYYAVADTIEHTLKDEGPYRVKEDYKTAADDIYAPHRYRIYYGDYVGEYTSEGYFIPDLPQRLPSHTIPDKKNNNITWESKQFATAVLCKDGLRVRSKPQFIEVDSEGPIEVGRYFGIMIPLSMKVKIKSIKSLFGGTPGIVDNVSYDATGLHFVDSESTYADSEGNVYWDAVKDLKDIDKIVLGHTWLDDNNYVSYPLTVPKVHYFPGESWYFQSTYVIDPDGGSPDNPRGEYICWYICSRETTTGIISRFFGPEKYREDQKIEPHYDFLIQFEEIK